MDRVLHFFLKTNSGRLVLVALVALLVAYIARVQLVDLPAKEAKDAAGAGAETIELMADALVNASDKRGEALAAELPSRTEWYPTEVPCAVALPYPKPRDAVWDLLGLPADGETQFQYRFFHDDGAVRIWARRDSDCDGFYAVWLLEGRVSTSLGRDVTAQNILE